MQRSMIRLVSLADLFSITNAVFGFLAILALFTDLLGPLTIKVHVSLSLILLGLLADGLDGIIARKLKKSQIGEYLEAMADMVSMCVAPAAFIFFVYYSSEIISFSIYRYIYLIIALILFLSFGILRLASFHIIKEEKIYIGLPASASAILLLILAYFEVWFILILPAVVIIGSFMVSNIVFPKPDLKISGVAFILILLTIIFGKTFFGIAPLLLFLAILIYVIAGPIYLKILKKS